MAALMFIADWLSRVPATFWGILAGSLFSLTGVWLTTRAAASNLRTQHDHDRKMRNRDRELALRRDIYLAAAEALAAGFYCLGKFGDFKIEGQELTAAFIEKAPALAKVNIVADTALLRAITAVEGDLNAAFQRLHCERVVGMIAKRDHLILSKRIESYLAIQTRSVEMMNEENLKGRPDQHRWEQIQRNFEFASAQINADIPGQRHLEATIQSETIRISGVATKEALGLIDGFVPTVARVRTELDLAIDEAALRQIFLDVAVRTHEGMSQFIQEMKASVDEHEKVKFTDQLKLKPPPAISKN